MHKMEPLGLGAFPDGERDCFHRTFVTERHYLPQFLDHSSVLLGEEDGKTGIQPMFFPTPESEQNESLFHSFDAHNSNLHFISQESSHSSSSSGGFGVFVANPGHTNSPFGNPDYVLPNDTCTSIDCYMIDLTVTDIVMEENASLNEDERSDYGSEKSDHSQVEPVVFPPKHLQLKRKLDLPELEVPEEDKIYLDSSGNDQKKKPRVSKDVQRCMKNARSQKNQKHNRSENEAEETNAGSDGQVSSSYTSDDDNANQENSTSASKSKSPAALSLNGKTRASRASATDPQSLYARKRRERINEGLRILQNLVPSGTKVDISTMLEEAVHYMKFLQLQIKLLSSDDLWMYAPIAYKGLDIGPNLIRKITRPL